MIVSVVLRLVLSIFVGRRKQQYQDENCTGADGDVKVSSAQKIRNKVVEKDMGEYVDYEVVKED